MSAVGTIEPIDVMQEWSACWGAADGVGQVQDRCRVTRTVTEFYRSADQSEPPLIRFYASENICSVVVTSSRLTLPRAADGSRP
jgi:hypothetical protein